MLGLKATLTNMIHFHHNMLYSHISQIFFVHFHVNSRKSKSLSSANLKFEGGMLY